MPFIFTLGYIKMPSGPFSRVFCLMCVDSASGSEGRGAPLPFFGFAVFSDLARAGTHDTHTDTPPECAERKNDVTANTNTVNMLRKGCMRA